MKLPVPFSSSQILATVLSAGALLGGAYALGRSQSDATPPAPPAPLMTAASPELSATASPETGSERKSTSAREASERAKEPARLCTDCARVLSIQQETREGKASGLGAVGGAVIGGLLGNQIGGGNGKKIATVGGVVAGGMAGHEIEKHQKAQRVWVVRVKNSDGRSQTFVRENDPQFSVGDVLQLRDGQFQRQL